MDPIPAELIIDPYPRAIRTQANRLRGLVRAAAPTATERVRIGWRIICYDLPLGRKTRFFAWVMVERVHVHLGFEYGAWMQDPDRVLEGAHLRLKRVRFVTFVPGQPIPGPAVKVLLREAAVVACMTPVERSARAMDVAWSPAPKE